MGIRDNINVRVAEKVFGLHVESVVKKDMGGNNIEVLLFFAPGRRFVEYSFDLNSCNWMMYRNGVDDKNGTAEPLPQYDDDLNWSFDMLERCYHWTLTRNKDSDLYECAAQFTVDSLVAHTECDRPAEAIVRAVLSSAEG